MKTYYEFITDYLEDLSDDELIEQWNEYCRDSYSDDEIYYNDEYFLDEMFASADDAARAICYGDYRYMDEYVVFNGYGNLESFSGYCLKDYIYICDLASYLEGNGFLEDEYQEYIEEFKEV